MNIKQPPPVGTYSCGVGVYTMLEESNAFTMVFLDLSSLQTNLYTRLRITDWQHWVFVIAQVALVLSNLDKPMFICNLQIDMFL